MSVMIEETFGPVTPILAIDSIEPLLETFGYGTPPFDILNREFRRRVMEEAARHDVDLVFTVVWALDSQDDLREMESYVGIFGSVAFVELRADLGYAPDEQICIVTVGGSGVGTPLLRRVMEAHGRGSIAMYLGNPNVHNLGSMLYVRPFVKALGTGGARQRTELRQVGDLSLFISGFFSDSLQRRAVDGKPARARQHERAERGARR